MLSQPTETLELLDEIIGVLMECTVMIEGVYCARSEDAVQETIISCLKLKQEAQLWYERLKSTNEGPLYTLMPDEANIHHSSMTKLLFPERCEFASVDLAEAHMLYCTALLIISSLFYEVERRKECNQRSPSDDPGLEHCATYCDKGSGPLLKESKFYADQICRGAGYFIQPHMHILGAHHLLFPLTMAAKFFYGNGFGDRYHWCQEVLTVLGNTGIGLASILQGTPWSKYNTEENQNVHIMARGSPTNVIVNLEV